MMWALAAGTPKSRAVRMLSAATAIVWALGCSTARPVPHFLGRYRYGGTESQEEATSRAVAYSTGDEGRVIAISEGLVIGVSEVVSNRVGVGVMIAHPGIGKWA